MEGLRIILNERKFCVIWSSEMLMVSLKEWTAFSVLFFGALLTTFGVLISGPFWWRAEMCQIALRRQDKSTSIPSRKGSIGGIKATSSWEERSGGYNGWIQTSDRRHVEKEFDFTAIFQKGVDMGSDGRIYIEVDQSSLWGRHFSGSDLPEDEDDVFSIRGVTQAQSINVWLCQDL